MHVAAPYGCHMERLNRETCVANDAGLAAFLSSFVPSHPNTAVVLMSDHGFHWRKKTTAFNGIRRSGEFKPGFNEFLAGEWEHRNPVLNIIIPSDHDARTLRRNAARFVTHRDVHATVMGLIGGQTQNGTNLLTRDLPELRSCAEAGIPAEWCNCFVRAVDGCRVDSDRGCVKANGTEAAEPRLVGSAASETPLVHYFAAAERPLLRQIAALPPSNETRVISYVRVMLIIFCPES